MPFPHQAVFQAGRQHARYDQAGQERLGCSHGAFNNYLAYISKEGLADMGQKYDHGLISEEQLRALIVRLLEDASCEASRLRKIYGDLEAAGLSLFIPADYQVHREDLHEVRARSGRFVAWSLRLLILGSIAAIMLIYGTDAYMVVREGEEMWRRELNQTGWLLLAPALLLAAGALLIRAGWFASRRDYYRSPTPLDVPVFDKRHNHAWKSGWLKDGGNRQTA